MKSLELTARASTNFPSNTINKASPSFTDWLITTAKENPYFMTAATTATVAAAGLLVYSLYSFYRAANKYDKPTSKPNENSGSQDSTIVAQSDKKITSSTKVIHTTNRSLGNSAASSNPNNSNKAETQAKTTPALKVEPTATVAAAANPSPKNSAPKLRQISIGRNGEIWGINAAEEIFQYLHHTGWKKVSGTLKNISVGANGEVWGVDSKNTIHRYIGKEKWELIPGSLKQLSVGANGEVWGVNTQNDIYRYSGNKTWELIPGSLKQISVGANGEVWGVNAQNDIYRYSGNKSWELIPGSLKQISVGANGEVWGVNASNTLYRYTEDKKWVNIQGHASGIAYVSVSPDDEVYSLNSLDELLQYEGDTTWEMFTRDKFSDTDLPDNEKILYKRAHSIKDEDGLTPLHRATANDDLKEMLLLLDLSADPNAVSENSWGITPIFYAKSKEAMALLVKYGAIVNVKERGNDFYTPLHRATERQDEEQILFLLAFGANIDENRDGHGTPLHTAAYGSLSVSAKLLIECGANRTIQNVERKTPAQFALDPAGKPTHVKQQVSGIISNTPVNHSRLEVAKKEAQRLLTLLTDSLSNHVFDNPEKLIAALKGTDIDTSISTSSSSSLVNINTLSDSTQPVPINYRYFRFTPMKLRGGAGATDTCVQLSQLQFKYQGKVITGAVASNPGGNNPTNERPQNVLDGKTSTKWLDFNRQPLLVDFNQPVQIDAYTWATANDGPYRDPISWALEGSNDNSNWHIIDIQLDYSTPTERFKYLPDFNFNSFIPQVVITPLPPVPSAASVAPVPQAIVAPTTINSNNWAIVRVWLPRDEKGRFVPVHEVAWWKNGPVGHASLETNDFYASFWPEEKTQKGWLIDSVHIDEALEGGESSGNLRFDDIHCKLMPPDVIVVLYTLDTDAMKRKFLKLDSKNKLDKWSHWGGLNCGELVYKLLKAGGIKKLDIKWPSYRRLLTAPDTIAYMALSAAKSERQRCPHTQRINPPPLENSLNNYTFRRPLPIPDYRRYTPHDHHNRHILKSNSNIFMSQLPTTPRPVPPEVTQQAIAKKKPINEQLDKQRTSRPGFTGNTGTIKGFPISVIKKSPGPT